MTTEYLTLHDAWSTCADVKRIADRAIWGRQQHVWRNLLAYLWAADDNMTMFEISRELPLARNQSRPYKPQMVNVKIYRAALALSVVGAPKIMSLRQIRKTWRAEKEQMGTDRAKEWRNEAEQWMYLYTLDYGVANAWDTPRQMVRDYDLGHIGAAGLADRISEYANSCFQAALREVRENKNG